MTFFQIDSSPVFVKSQGDAAAVAARSTLWQWVSSDDADGHGTVVLSSCSHRCEAPSDGEALHRPLEDLMETTGMKEKYQDWRVLQENRRNTNNNLWILNDDDDDDDDDDDGFCFEFGMAW